MKLQPIKTGPTDSLTQLEDAKQLGKSTLSQSKTLDELKRSTRSLSDALTNLGVSDQTLVDIDQNVLDIKDRLTAIAGESSSRVKQLELAQVQSKGVQEGVQGVLTWLQVTEKTLDNMKPVSLNEEVLSDQAQEIQEVRADIEDHTPGVESINKSVQDMIRTGDPSTKVNLQQKLDKLNKSFEKCERRASQRQHDIKLISDKLNDFVELSTDMENWLFSNFEALESQDVDENEIETGELKDKLRTIGLNTKERERQLKELEQMGEELVKHPNSGDVVPVKDRLVKLKHDWTDFNTVYGEKQTVVEEQQQQSHR